MTDAELVKIGCGHCHQFFPSLIEHLVAVNWHAGDPVHEGDPNCILCRDREKLNIAREGLERSDSDEARSALKKIERLEELEGLQ